MMYRRKAKNREGLSWKLDESEIKIKSTMGLKTSIHIGEDYHKAIKLP